MVLISRCYLPSNNIEMEYFSFGSWEYDTPMGQSDTQCIPQRSKKTEKQKEKTKEDELYRGHPKKGICLLASGQE